MFLIELKEDVGKSRIGLQVPISTDRFEKFKLVVSLLGQRNQSKNQLTNYCDLRTISLLIFQISLPLRKMSRELKWDSSDDIIKFLNSFEPAFVYEQVVLSVSQSLCVKLMSLFTKIVKKSMASDFLGDPQRSPEKLCITNLHCVYIFSKLGSI